MQAHHPPSNIRKGRFINLDEDSQQSYLNELSRKIENGYYFSDRIMEKIVDEIAPVFQDHLEHESAM
ncbi:MAG: hypothetical protein GF398_10680 [Chitinivibrionales bacterium]|nr:hypothetical protein [Chitinivibrionales bacterium]